MGAKLSLLAQTSPSIGIFSYIDILQDVHYISQLNSSKFLKTCKALDPNGEIVVKVFIKPNEEFTKQFSLVVKRIQEQQIQLAKLSSVLNYSKIIDSKRAIYLIRQHLKGNLYDRLSLRPYLHPTELKFITFQLLKVISEIHDLDIVHGNLKTENILINSWNWIVITDFASLIKPVYLPEDNPNEFTFYFDTSKRRSCYLAPERFDSKLYSEMNRNITSSISHNNNFQVTKEMDIFSVGCCIAELFLEGIPLFNLSQLFKYKNNEYDPYQFLMDNILGLGMSTEEEISKDKDTSNVLSNNANNNTISSDDRKQVCNLIMDMINIDPQKRLSCKDILVKYRNIFFPDYFYTFTYDYLKTLAILSTNIPTNDKLVTVCTLQDNLNNILENCVKKIYLDFGKICNRLNFPIANCDDNLQINKSMFKFPNKFIKFSKDLCIQLNSFKNYSAKTQTVKEECSLLYLSFLLHSLRCCSFESTQIKCLELITALSQFISDENKLDRVIPYLVNCFLNSKSTNIQSLALQNVCQILSSVEEVNALNANIFIDYLFPKIKKLLQQCNIINNITTINNDTQYVKIVLANCLGDLVTIAERFEELNSSNYPKTNENYILQGFTDLHIQSKPLRKLIQLVSDLTILLLTDNSVPVKISLLKNILPLCKFFGKERTNDIILSHLITYLNDRNYLLRMTLIETIPSIAILLGPITLERYILPLLIQSLIDSEECVIIAVLYGIKDLCKVGLISKLVLYDLASTVTSLVFHPNYSIRNVTIHIIYQISQQLSKAEIYCKLYPIIRPYFGFDVEFSLDLLIESCKQPVSRTIFNLLCSWSLHASKSLFWKQIDNNDIDIFGNRIITFIDKNYISKNFLANSNDRKVTKEIGTMYTVSQKRKAFDEDLKTDSMLNLDNIEVPLTTEDKLWIEKFIATGMKGKDLWKLEILRSYVIRYTKTWNKSSNRLNEQNNLYGYQDINSNKTFNVIPRNIFFDIKFIAPNNLLHTSQYNDIPRALQIKQGSTISDKNRLVQLHNNKAKLLNLINVNGSLLFQSQLLGTTTSNLNNIYVECDTKLGLNGNSLSEENLEHYRSTKQYIVESSYEGTSDTIKRFIDSCNIVPSLKEYKEFGLQFNVEQSHLDFRDPSGIFIANLSENIGDSIITMIASQEKYSFLFTGSLHGIISIWDILSITNGNKISTIVKYICGASITDMKLLPGFDTVIISLNNGVILCLRIISTIEEGVKKFSKLTRIRQLNINSLSNQKGLTSNDSFIKKFIICPTEETSIIIALTNRHKILLIDIRDMNFLNSIQIPKKYGAISCFEVNPNDMTLIIGTMRGIINVWDLRFNILLSSFTFGDHSSIIDIKLLPHLGANHICVIRGSSNPLFSIWDYSKMVCKFAALISDEVPSIQTFVAISKNLDERKYDIDINKGSISAVKVSGVSVIIAQHNIQDLLWFDLLNYSNCKILFKNTFKDYEFTPVQLTANLTILLVKPSVARSLKSNMHVPKETVNHIELGKINKESILFTVNSQNFVSVYK